MPGRTHLATIARMTVAAKKIRLLARSRIFIDQRNR